MNEFEPDGGPPPRQVEPWTQVVGHKVIRGTRTFCSCGWSASEGESSDDHLANAWPVVLPRFVDETDRQWHARVASAHAEALETRERLWERDGHDGPIPPGGAFPVDSDELSRAEDLVTVLEWQLTQIPRALD